MRIFYYFSSYISHLTAGLDYARCLARLGHDVRTNLPEGEEVRWLGLPASATGGFAAVASAAPTDGPSRQADSQSSRLSGGSSASCPPASCLFVQSPLPSPVPDSALSAAQLKAAREAELFILHDDPLAHDRVYAALPFLHGLEVVAYTAWENEQLSPMYIKPLQRVSRVWTCSEFSRGAIAPHVAHCAVLPHLVERGKASAADLAWAREALAGFASPPSSTSQISPASSGSSGSTGSLASYARQDGSIPGSSASGNSGGAAQRNAPFVFLSVVDAINPRKNLRGLLTAYGLLRKMTTRPVRLLLKQYRLDMDFSGIEGVSSITGDLSEGRMAALYGSCDAYVSAHHSEGWGLGLSSAMAFGKPVIATGYSGNMQFMNDANSLPVPYSLVPVSQEMCKMIPLFTSEMRWAEPDLAAMAGLMRRAVEGRLEPGLPGQAAAIVRSFGSASIMKRLEELLVGF